MCNSTLGAPYFTLQFFQEKLKTKNLTKNLRNIFTILRIKNTTTKKLCAKGKESTAEFFFQKNSHKKINNQTLKTKKTLSEKQRVFLKFLKNLERQILNRDLIRIRIYSFCRIGFLVFRNTASLSCTTIKGRSITFATKHNHIIQIHFGS